jgi:hypothetical protein
MAAPGEEAPKPWGVAVEMAARDERKEAATDGNIAAATPETAKRGGASRPVFFDRVDQITYDLSGG